MKRYILAALSALLIRLLASCQEAPARAPETEPETKAETVAESESKTDADMGQETVAETNAQPSGEVATKDCIFTSIADLKTYYATGSEDISSYEGSVLQSLSEGVQDIREFPSRDFVSGYFVDLYELFPGLKNDRLIFEQAKLEYIPIVSSGKYVGNKYKYYGHTKDETAGYRITVTYQKNVGDMTEKDVAAAYAEGFTAPWGETIFEDYTKTDNKPNTQNGIMYISSGEGYVINYEVWNGTATAMSIRVGDVQIQISGYPGGYKDLLHADLRPLRCLFEDSPERDEALKRIVDYCQALQKEHV